MMYGMALTWFACFNPRLRTGGDSQSLMLCPPARSFNPRLRTGGDQGVFKKVRNQTMFQSTPPHGRRPSSVFIPARSFAVSIHASAREATAPSQTFTLGSSGFNPRLRTGGDPCTSDACAAFKLFQSTPPHGRRRRLFYGVCGGRQFQSTPPHGRRRGGSRYGRGQELVSIHASAREATAD